jgi:hypothetical protein
MGVDPNDPLVRTAAFMAFVMCMAVFVTMFSIYAAGKTPKCLKLVGLLPFGLSWPYRSQ